MKDEIRILDATPSKRLYLSIIADYDTNKAISELVDNALDIWTLGGRQSPLAVSIVLDSVQQTIEVTDNAGGIPEGDLSFVIAPGYSRSSGADQIIGIFGVGTKRAVVALAQQVKISTRQKLDTYLVEFDDSWIEQGETWNLPVYRVSPISPGTTKIELVRLRAQLDDPQVNNLREHLSYTYAVFLKDSRLSVTLNGEAIRPTTYENWAFPPGFEPHNYTGRIPTKDGTAVDALVTAGLITESSPAGGEYGVYFYCNDRLIVRGMKTFDVGFASGLSGKPHADISLARVIVSLHGPARLMPWNSSKSDINPSHEVFRALRSWLISVVKDYTSLCRRLSKAEGGWQESVFKYDSGDFVDVDIGDISVANTSYLPPLPEVKPRYPAVLQQINKAVANAKPWTKGLYESVAAADWVMKQTLEQRNRIALIILDSTLEIAFKEYLVNESGKYFSDQQLQNVFEKRHLVHKEIQACIAIAKLTWQKIGHYYNMRCQLVHRRATVAVSDDDISDFRKTVESVLKKLYKLQF